MSRVTHTYVLMDLSPSAYNEIKKKLLAAGYSHAVHEAHDGERLDMHGIAVTMEDKIHEPVATLGTDVFWDDREEG